MTAQSLWFQGISALQSREFLRRSDSEISKSIERLSTGLRINSAEDDPSGLHLSRAGYANRMGRIQAALENVQMGINFMDLRYEALINSRDALMRIRDIAVRSANDAVITDAQRVAMQDEVDGLLEAIDNNRNIAFRMDTSSGEGSKVLFDPGQLDVVWVLDATGSMGWVYNALETAADQMYADLKSKKFDLRMGAVGFGSGAGVLGTTLPPPNNAIIPTGSGGGSLMLQDNGGSFKADVTSIKGIIPFYGAERGLDGTMEAIWGTGIKAQMDARPDAARVVIMITDADSDDFGSFAQDVTMTNTPAAIAARDFVVSSLDSLGAAYYVVSTVTEGGGSWPADADYTDVSSRVAAGGGSMALDVTNAWVSTISDTLQAYGGPYSMKFQIGADNVAQDQIELNFKTVTARAAKISVSLTDASAASNSITNIKSALEFITTEHAKTGEYMQRVQHIIEDLETERLNTIAAKSRIKDADFALEASEMSKQQIIMNSAVAVSSQANSSPGVVLDLLSENGVGQSGATSAATSGL